MLRIILAVSAVVAGLAWLPADAQEDENRLVSEINAGTVGIISGGYTGTYIRIAADLSAVLDDGNALRIIPYSGKGSVQNIADMLYLKGIDVGIVQSDVLEYAKSQGLFGEDIQNQLRYITKLYNEEFHLVAKESVQSVHDLAGKKVNFDVEGSGTYMTASVVFGALGVDVEPTTFPQDVALEKVKSGEIAATVFVAGKPARTFADIKPEDRLRLVPVDYQGDLRNSYLPSTFSDADYPGLVPPGETVDTIAVGAVMAVFNWAEDSERYRRVAQFVQAFFGNFDALQKQPRHQKWQEVNLSAKMPGWVRMKAAEDWLAAHPAQSTSELFQQFIQWQRQRQ